MEKTSDQSRLGQGKVVGRRAFVGAAGMVALAGVTASKAVASPSGTSIQDGAKLVWSEHFDGEALNQDLWEYELGNIRGNEQEHYSSSQENVRVKDGQLVIAVTDRPVEDQYRNTARHGAKARLVKYNSGSIRTHAKKDFLYGKLEVRVRLPKGKGAFPAIWMLGHEFHLDGRIATSQGTGWPSCGELDVVELIGAPTANRASQGEIASSGVSNRKIYGTPHFAYSRGDADGDGSYSPQTLGGAAVIGSDFNDDFHVFGINRTPEKLEWLLDGQVYKTLVFTDPDPVENERRKAAAAGMLRPMYLQINLATGGNWAGDAGDYLAQDGTELVVDWVQYSQTDAQKASEQAYYAALPVISGVADIAIRQGQQVNLAEHVSVNRAGYEVVWSVNDTPMFVNGGVTGGRNEVHVVASSKGSPQTTADLPVGVYSVYYTALPVGTDLGTAYKLAPTIPTRRAKATLAVLPAAGLTGNPHAAVASVKVPTGWTFSKPSQKLNREISFDVTFVNPLDGSVPSAKRLPVDFTIPRDAITWR